MTAQLEIKIRRSRYAADGNLSFSEAVSRLEGGHEDDRGRYHESESVCVVLAYASDASYRTHSAKLISKPAGYPEYGVDVYGRRTTYGGVLGPAEVNWSAVGSVSPAIATLYAQAMLLAAQLADAASSQLSCPDCKPVAS